MAKTAMLCKGDFRTERGGYHFDVWPDTCEMLGLPKDYEGMIEVALVSHEPAASENLVNEPSIKSILGG